MIPCDKTEASCTLSKVGKIAESVEKKQRLIFTVLKKGTQNLLSDLFFTEIYSRFLKQQTLRRSRLTIEVLEKR